MARPFNPDLTVNWKIPLPATVAGTVEYMLSDPLHQKPIYGARNKLFIAMLQWWIEREKGTPAAALPPIPTMLELRERTD